MARIQTPQHVQELQAEFKVREPFGLELLETIQPTYSLGSQKVASTGYPRKAFGVISAGAGGVGTNIECALRCPGGVGIIIVLDHVSFDNVAGEISCRMTDGVAMATVSGVSAFKAYRDGRLTDSRPQGVLEIANPLTAAANGLFVGQYSTLADDTVRIDMDVILGSESYILFRNTTANAGLEINFNWTEFLLEDR